MLAIAQERAPGNVVARVCCKLLKAKLVNGDEFVVTGVAREASTDDDDADNDWRRKQRAPDPAGGGGSSDEDWLQPPKKPRQRAQPRPRLSTERRLCDVPLALEEDILGVVVDHYMFSKVLTCLFTCLRTCSLTCVLTQGSLKITTLNARMPMATPSTSRT